MLGIIVLYILADAKITIDDRIELFTKEILSNTHNQTDTLVLDSGILKTELVNYVSPKNGIKSLLLMDLLLNYLSLKEEDLLLMQIDGFRQYLYKHYDLYLIHSRSSGT